MVQPRLGLPITIDPTKVPADQTDVPVLISFTDSNRSAQAQTSGNDILFTSSDGTTKLSHEIEAYTSGTLVAWVNVPLLSSAANTTIFMYYGCATASGQQDKNNVRDTGFKGVWHLNEGTGVTAVDPTSNANSATPVDNPAASTGQIGGALTFAGPDNLTIAADASLDLTTYSTWTMSAWVKPTSYTSLKWPITQVRQSTDPVTLNAWNHVTITRTATATSSCLNGIADGSSSASPVATANQASYIGGWNDGNIDYQYLGPIDEVRLSASSAPGGARSAGWIRTGYNNQNSPSTFRYITGQEEGTC
jgi:hypothetical protein